MRHSSRAALSANIASETAAPALPSAPARYFGKEHGVMLAIQQHNDFLKTDGETIRLI